MRPGQELLPDPCTLLPPALLRAGGSVVVLRCAPWQSRLSSQHPQLSLSCRTRATSGSSWDHSLPVGAQANPQLGSLQATLSSLHAALLHRPRGLANWCEQCYLFSDLWERRPAGSEEPLPPSLLPFQVCGEVLTGLVLCHLCLGYPAIACTTKASARLTALGSWPQWLKVLLNICSLPGVPPVLEPEPSINSPAPFGDVRLLSCSAKMLKMQLLQSTTKQQTGLGRSSVMPSSLSSPCSAVLCPVRQHYHAIGKQGQGLHFLKCWVTRHSALCRSGAHSVPG